jgi:glutathione peroxidase
LAQGHLIQDHTSVQLLILHLCFLAMGCSQAPAKEPECSSFFEYSAKNKIGEMVSFSKFKGKTILVSNVASQAQGVKQNYDEFAKLVNLFKDQNFAVILFPNNQFMQTEPDDAPDPRDMKRWSVSIDADMLNNDQFNIMQKVDVNGKDSHPVFDFLKKGSQIREVPWSFSKWIIDPSGNVAKFVPSEGGKRQVMPMELMDDIQSSMRRT